MERISNVVKVSTSKAHQNLIWLSKRNIFFDKGKKLIRNIVLHFKILDIKRKFFMIFLLKIIFKFSWFLRILSKF